MTVLAKDGEMLEEVELIQLIRCELTYGVQNVLKTFPKGTDKLKGYHVEWLRDWEAKLSLKVTVDEKSSLAPGATYKEPLRNAVTHFNVTVPQMASASIGLKASSQATRVETIGFSYTFGDLLKDRENLPELKKGDCEEQIAHKVVVSDFKIADFLLNKAYVANHTDTVINRSGESPYSTFSYDVTFAVTYGGSATPIWNLIHVTASSNSPFYEAVRTKTHNLTITLGKVGSGQAAAVANANLIGQAVARALESH